jgi:uncharacterized secreted protein with C-terminal beta-propeller domain
MWKINKINLFVIIFFFLFINTSFAFSQIKCDLSKLKPVKFGEKNIYVKNLKLCLKEAGYNFGNVLNSSYDDQMLKAVKNFYKSWYGDVDGKYFGKLGINKLKLLIEDLSKSKINKNLKKFSSKEEFISYLNEAKKKYPEVSYGYRKGKGGVFLETVPLYAPQAFSPAEPSRYSETTVQVKGIDEADIVKTDGKNIYYSITKVYYFKPVFEEKLGILPEFATPTTKIIKAFPVDELKEESKIEETGDLYLVKSKKILVILTGNKISGYDVSNIQKPVKKWEIKLDGDISTSRFYQDKIYLITKQYLDYEKPCPIIPLILNNKEIKINCQDIYVPPAVLPVENIISVFVIEPDTGEILQKTALLENSDWYGGTVVYMSYNNLYITYPNEMKESELWIDTIINAFKDIFPQTLIDKIAKLKNLDLYESSKMNELEAILNSQEVQKYTENYCKKFESLDRCSEAIEERIKTYYINKVRDYDKSFVVKIDLNNLNIKTIGEVPGIALNQFSLDEYQGKLRIGVTIGERTREGTFHLGSFISLNDVYVLDENLKIIGGVKDLGKGEKIYAVRFVEDKGYVVTFRETDPFYVIDLSNPYDPKLKGELKIPGYSSYLHPITKDKILGIGKESSKVKISLFDVSNPSNPIEKSKYVLDEYWSKVLENFHAFLLDDKHQIFFIPASKGYIFSYKDDELTLKKEVSFSEPPERAIYIDDYLYLISRSNIIIFDENTFDKVKELNLK